MPGKLKLLLIVLFSLTIISCSDTIINNNLVEKPNNENLSKQENSVREYPVTTITKRINGKAGGVINLTGLCIGPNLNVITISASLTIPPKAFNGIRDITLTADYETPGIIFDPDMIFDLPLELDLLYVGLDLISLQLFPGQIDFGYLGDEDDINEIFEPCEYEAIDINLLTGLLGVRKARINHFSRYGYTR